MKYKIKNKNNYDSINNKKRRKQKQNVGRRNRVKRDNDYYRRNTND